jgi:hypothetical protein
MSRIFTALGCNLGNTTGGSISSGWLACKASSVVLNLNSLPYNYVVSDNNRDALVCQEIRLSGNIWEVLGSKLGHLPVIIT